MKKIYFSLLLMMSSSIVWAQEDELKHCGADEMRIGTLKQFPKIAAAVIQRDQQLEQFTQRYVNDFYSGNTRSATYTIPVVFHVIHNFGVENISDAQILDGLDILNKTFRKQLADTASIVAAFKPLHADCDIEFKLAQIDPDGNCTRGINRIPSLLTNTGDHGVKTLIHWPPDKYLNIYIVKNAAGLAGHCVWPSDADTIPDWDGIVIGHNYVGSIGTSNYTQSVALAHECGHYLNLQHIWGGNNVPGYYYYPCADPDKDCSIDDLVADTPPTIGWQTCNLSGASCGNTVDNVQNAMDYSYCNRMFTYGQKARMHACLNSPIAHRDNLWSPANLAATGVALAPAPLCQADFTSDKTVICSAAPNNVVSFNNTSYNGTFTSVEWTFAGGTPAASSSNNPSVTYNAPGTYAVKLKVKNGTDSLEVTRTRYIKVLSPTGTNTWPYTESFESVDSLTGPGWFTNNIESLSNWSLAGTAYTGAKSVMLDNFNNTSAGKDELIGPVVDLSGASVMRLSFRYAFARKDSVNNDKLQLLVTNNCGSTWIPRLTLTDTTLETAPLSTSLFTPAGTTQWKQVSASIPTSYLTNDFRFKFVHFSYGGNNLYLDDINIDVNSGVENELGTVTNLQVFPNPANDAVTISFELAVSEELDIYLTDLLGKTVLNNGKKFYPEGKFEEKLSLHHLSPGVYLVNFENGTNKTCKKLLITSR